LTARLEFTPILPVLFLTERSSEALLIGFLKQEFTILFSLYVNCMLDHNDIINDNNYQ
jgi:hypothetical protein